MNFFKINNEKNPYQDSWYDLEEKKLYNYQKIDLLKLVYNSCPQVI